MVFKNVIAINKLCSKWQLNGGYVYLCGSHSNAVDISKINPLAKSIKGYWFHRGARELFIGNGNRVLYSISFLIGTTSMSYCEWKLI